MGRKEANRYTSNLVPVENQLLSGSESEGQNNLMEEFKEENFMDEEQYEEELEYVEIENEKKKISKKQKLYLNSDFSEQPETQVDEDNDKEFAVQRKSSSNRASKRPIQRSKEPLDIEPVEDEKLVIKNPKSESFEIDDPW